VEKINNFQNLQTMNGLCPASCSSITLLQNPQANCIDSIRRKTLSRIFFYPCSTILPAPISNTNIAPLFANGTIVSTNRLANINVADPQTEDVLVDECSAARKFITTRELTCEDRIAVEVNPTSPGGDNPYFDYDWWADKGDQQLVLNAMLAYCDGDVIIPLDKNGNPLSFTLLAHLSWQKPQQQGGAWVEFKKITMNFMGDPFALINKPAFNWIKAGIQL
jgi:hypothetical protein